MTTRRAVVKSNDLRAIEAYLPSNYKVVEVVIEGEDSAGWTLDGYVLPRLASGLHFGKEVPLP